MNVLSKHCEKPSTARGRRWPRWAAPTLVAAAVIASIYAVSPNYRWEQGERKSPYAGDYLQEWIGGYAVLRGESGRLYESAYAKALQHDASVVGFSFDRRQYLPLVYPPFYYVLVSPLSLVPYREAAWIWSGLMCAAFGGAIVLAVRSSFESRPSPPAPLPEAGRGELPAWWAIPVAALFAPLLESLNSGQKGTVCLLLLSATWFLLARGRPLAAGLVFGLLAFKPQLVLVIAVAMLLKGQWRFVAGGAICGATLIGVSLLLGADVCGDYVAFSAGAAEYFQTAGYDLHESHCLYGFFNLAVGRHSPVAAKLATGTAALVVVWLLARLLRGRFSTASPHFDGQFSALVIATVLLSPHLYTYDLTVLLLPMFLLGRRSLGEATLTPRSTALGVLLIGLFFVSGVSPSIAAQVTIQITTAVMVALLVVLVRSRQAGA